MPEGEMTYGFRGLGSYEAFRDELIKRAENPDYLEPQAEAQGFAKGDRPTAGFGYDLPAKKDPKDPEGFRKIFQDFHAAGIALSTQQQVAILYWGGWSKERLREYVSKPGDNPYLAQDLDFIDRLGADDRTNAGLKAQLGALLVTRDQADALYAISVQEAEAEVSRRLSAMPKAVREKFKQGSGQRAVLVNLAYQGPKFLGKFLLRDLAAGDLAGAAFEIAFLSNKKPGEFPGIDARNFERARTFLGGTLAPRTKAEAEAFLRAVAARSDDLAQALHNREGRIELSEPYRRRLQELVDASVRVANIDTTLRLQADGSFLVGNEVPLDALARAFGLSPLALALVNPDLFPNAPDSSTKFPADQALHLPNERELETLKKTGVAVTSTAPAAPLTPGAYGALRKEYQKNLAHPPQSPPKPVTPRRGRASLQGDELLGQFSPASLEIAETLGQRFSPTLDPAVATRLFPELEALPVLASADDLGELTAAVGFGSTSGLEFLAPRKEDYLTADGFAPLMRYSTARRGFDRAALERIEAAIARCITQAERLDREVDRWIERRNAARRRRPFEPY